MVRRGHLAPFSIAAVMAVVLTGAACAGGSDDDPATGDTTAASDAMDATNPTSTTATSATGPVQATVPGDTTGVPATLEPALTTPKGTAPGADDAEYGGDPMSSDRAIFEEGDIDVGLTPFIDLAVADLAERLAVEPDEIVPVTGVLVVWSDTSLGCPEPDMVYGQIVGDGAVIELRVDDRYYRYHTGGNAELFLCEQPWAGAIVGGDPGGLPKPDSIDS